MATQVDKLFRVDGIVALITGGGTGLGLIMAKALALNGAHKVFITGRRTEVLEAAAKESPHGNIIPITGDVTSKESLLSVAERIRSEVGYLNLLVANAGTTGPGPRFSKPADRKPMSVEEYQTAALENTYEQWDDCFRTNITGVWFSVMACLDLLDAGNKKGPFSQQGIRSQVVINSSVGGFLRGYGSGFPYRASKSGVTHLGKTLSTQFAEFGIRVNILAPGLFPSDMARVVMDKFAKFDSEDPTKLDRFLIPEQRHGTEEDMSGTILYLVSKAGAYNNGNVIVLDGGALAVMPAVY